jgi:penicillin amidase
MLRKIGRVLLVIFGTLSLILIVYGIFLVHRSFPKISGEIHLSSLDGPVDIYRDSNGIPQIYATTTHDLFFAEGYIHAQDRFWQMDFWRHVGSGRLSELLGKSPVKTDLFLRTLGWERIAKQEVQSMDQAELAVLQNYADGVNAYLKDHAGASLSLEYALLPLLNPHYQPAPWQPTNTLTWAKAMAWDLGSNMDSEINNAILLKTITSEQLAQLRPKYPADHPLIVPTPNTGAAPAGTLSSAIAPAYPSEALTALDQAAKNLEGVKALFGSGTVGIGSNNWVISGKLTQTGKPLLANDPHLSAQMPSIWYEVGLHCAPKSTECPLDVTGFSFAGTPGVVVGHNDRVAWGVTNVGPDVQDLYIEKINPANPNQYEVDGKWVDMTLVPETIQVGGGEAISMTVRYTRHGPIISDTYKSLKDFSQKANLDIPSSYAIALRWTALEPDTLVSAILKLDSAQNWEDFREAASYFSIAAQNMIYADVDGNIGYQMPGNIPIRNKGDGTFPVPGWTSEYEWSGYIPFEKHPFAYNPPQGFIATANNAIVGPDYPYLITTEWDMGYRASRIVEMIQSSPQPIDIATIQRIQGDNKNLMAEVLVPELLRLPITDPRVEKARALFNGWDYQFNMDSAPAALFASFWKHLLADTFYDQVSPDNWSGGDDVGFEVIRQLNQQPDNPWWDNVTTPQRETRDMIFTQALGEAVNELTQSLGNNPSSWKWGALHTVTFRNASFGKSGIPPIEAIFNRGPFRTSGSSSIVNATGWEITESYQVNWLPSMRMIVDLNNLANSICINTLGQSGHAYHPHYADMADRWRTIQYHPMLWTLQQAQANPEGHLRLLP